MNTTSGSTFLKDMIREKKAQNAKLISQPRPIIEQGSSRPNDMIESDDSSIQSRTVDTKSMRDANERRGSDTNITRGLAPQVHRMGLREMQEHLSKLDKQNFDLKIEIFHRRKQTEALEIKTQALRHAESELTGLRTENDNLRSQLQEVNSNLALRDAAVDEAVGIICDLEDNMDSLRSLLDDVKPSLPNGARRASWKQSSEHRTSATPSCAAKQDDINGNDDKSGDLAKYRSTDDGGSLQYSHVLVDDIDRYATASPVLSVLSESGFSSIYGDLSLLPPSSALRKVLSQISLRDESIDLPVRDTAGRQNRTTAWVDQDRSTMTLHTMPERHRGAKSLEFPSLNGAVARDSCVQVPQQHLRRRIDRSPVRLDRPSPSKSSRASSIQCRTLNTASPVTFHNDHLPPTPDTMSMRTSEVNSSTQSVVNELFVNRSPSSEQHGHTTHDSSTQQSSDRGQYRSLKSPQRTAACWDSGSPTSKQTERMAWFMPSPSDTITPTRASHDPIESPSPKAVRRLANSGMMISIASTQPPTKQSNSFQWGTNVISPIVTTRGGNEELVQPAQNQPTSTNSLKSPTATVTSTTSARFPSLSMPRFLWPSSGSGSTSSATTAATSITDQPSAALIPQHKTSLVTASRRLFRRNSTTVMPASSTQAPITTRRMSNASSSNIFRRPTSRQL